MYYMFHIFVFVVELSDELDDIQCIIGFVGRSAWVYVCGICLFDERWWIALFYKFLFEGYALGLIICLLSAIMSEATELAFVDVV